MSLIRKQRQAIFMKSVSKQFIHSKCFQYETLQDNISSMIACVFLLNFYLFFKEDKVISFSKLFSWKIIRIKYKKKSSYIKKIKKMTRRYFFAKLLNLISQRKNVQSYIISSYILTKITEV